MKFEMYNTKYEYNVLKKSNTWTNRRQFVLCRRKHHAFATNNYYKMSAAGDRLKPSPITCQPLQK